MPDLAQARAERQAAEQRLRHAQETVIEPLREARRELREKNHVAERLNALIRQQHGAGGSA